MATIESLLSSERSTSGRGNLLNLSKLNDQFRLISSELDRNPRTVGQLLKEIEDSKVRQIMDEVLLFLFIFSSIVQRD
jgi:hypothetical protein